LIEYIEDPCAAVDLAGYKKVIAKFGEKAPHVKVGVKNLFKDECGVARIKEITEEIQVDEDDQEAEGEGADEAKAEAKKAEMAKLEEQNALKLHPGVIHIDKTKLRAVCDIIEIRDYAFRTGNAFSIIIDDSHFEST